MVKKLKYEVRIPQYKVDQEYIKVIGRFKRTKPTSVDIAIKRIIESINIPTRKKRIKVLNKEDLLLLKRNKERHLL